MPLREKEGEMKTHFVSLHKMGNDFYILSTDKCGPKLSLITTHILGCVENDAHSRKQFRPFYTLILDGYAYSVEKRLSSYR